MNNILKRFIYYQIIFFLIQLIANILLFTSPVLILISLNCLILLCNICFNYFRLNKFIKHIEIEKLKQEKHFQSSIKNVYDEHIFSITHELRSPLAVIFASLNNQYNTVKGLYNSLSEEDRHAHKMQFKETKTNIENIKYQSEIIEKFIASISEHASYINETGAAKFINLHKYLQSVIINSLSYSRNMKIFQNRVSFGDITGADFMGVNVQVNPHDLSRMLINIMTNSADAVISNYKEMRKNSSYMPKLKIRCIRSELPYKNVVLCEEFVRIRAESDSYPFYILIEDNGPGISDENKKKIFNYGFTTKKQKENGKQSQSHYGLGLYLTISLANKNNIGLFVKSDSQGTIFALGFSNIYLGELDDKVLNKKDDEDSSIESDYTKILSEDTKNNLKLYGCSERKSALSPIIKKPMEL